MVFPNGVQLTPLKEALIIAEHGMARLIKYKIASLSLLLEI